MPKFSFKQWEHLEPADKARRIKIVENLLEAEISDLNSKPKNTYDPSRWQGMNAHAIYCVAARLDGDLESAQKFLNNAKPYSGANTRYATWVKFKRLVKPYRSILALAHKSNLLDDAKQLLANDLGLDEELQLELIKETNPQLVGDVGANPVATPKVMELVSDYKNVIARARLAENPGLSIDLMNKLAKDKPQAQIGLSNNWMITAEIRKVLFDTLDPGVVLNLIKRQDVDKEQSMDYVIRSISKHESSTKFEVKQFVASLKDWLIGPAETAEQVWQPSHSIHYSPPSVEITDEVLHEFRNKPLGYQDPEIPAAWLLKNVKNRSDEIKKDVLLNPSLPIEAMKILAVDKKAEIRKALSLLPNCPDDIKALAVLS